ncbi:hypothetical protein KKD52_16425, partial [Myxococcota bacterium]|nr:hypothetical protein [Myxococcota bacterium]MBU1511941.1 hypothetical protein [Myxococcota bacterium]
MNKAAFLLVILAMSGCFNDRKNPVKHSGELARRGHIDLYNNGAFRIPATEVKIIPPGSTPLELAKEFIGIKARDGFLMAIKEAAGSVYVLADGARLSLTTAQTITSEGTALANLIRSSTRRDGVIIISRSFAAGIGIIGDSWQLSKDLLAEMKLIGDVIVLSSRDAANAVDRNLTGGGLRLMKNSWVRSALIVRESGQRSRASVTSAYDGFIVGYAVLPALAAADAKSVAKAMKASNPIRIAREENQWRKEYSAYFAKLVTSAGSGYVGSIKTSFANAGRNLGNYRTTGISLASLRAMTWVLKGILYDAVLKPVVKLAVGAVGYIGVNGIAYPVMVVTRTGGNLTYVAVLLTYSATVNTYRLIAPSAVLAAAAVFGFFDVTLSTAGAGLTAAGGTTAGTLTAVTGKTTSMVLRTAGYAAGKAVQYIGVPLASAGIAVTGTTIGAIVSVAGVVPGGAVVVQGEAAGAVVQGGSYVGAGVVLTGGTALSAATALGKGAYYVAKAGLVPSGYTLGTGIVLGYGSATQLAAHTLLGLTDFAYLVLSLEGPRWVVYAIRGKTGNGKELPPGAALDLNKMRAAGEEIHAVPVSQGEMKKVVESVTKDFPVDARDAPPKPR